MSQKDECSNFLKCLLTFAFFCLTLIKSIGQILQSLVHKKDKKMQ